MATHGDTWRHLATPGDTWRPGDLATRRRDLEHCDAVPGFVQPNVVDCEHGDEGKEDCRSAGEVPQVVEVEEVQEDALAVQVAGLWRSQISARVAVRVAASGQDGEPDGDDGVEQSLSVGSARFSLPLHGHEEDEVEQEVEAEDDEDGIRDGLVRRVALQHAQPDGDEQVQEEVDQSKDEPSPRERLEKSEQVYSEAVFNF